MYADTFCFLNVGFTVFQTVSENTGSYWNPWAQVFACQTCNLVTALSEFFTAPAPDLLEKLPANLMSEWKEFFTEGVHSLLLPLFVKITGEPGR